jgi:hypothetical protein
MVPQKAEGAFVMLATISGMSFFPFCSYGLVRVPDKDHTAAEISRSRTASDGKAAFNR